MNLSSRVSYALTVHWLFSRLNADESIQMVTALALQLIQSVAKLPRPASGDDDEEDAEEDGAAAKDRRKSKNVDNEVLIVTSYETAMRTAHNFLAVFLRKYVPVVFVVAQISDFLQS